MRKPDKKGRTPGTPVSRRHVLSTGAAAAAGLGLGCPGTLEVEGPQPQEGTCVPPVKGQCGDSVPERWAISASVLNVLWGDFWPRFIAHGWNSPSFLLPYGPVRYADLQAAIDKLLGLAHDNPPGWTPGSPPVTPFQRRMALLSEYVGGTGPKIPINFIGDGAYDFVLSDAGLDLFTPSEPAYRCEYLRYYSFRRTGRPSLGIASYLDDADDLAFSTDAPTGPGQIFTTLAALNTTPVSTSGCLLGSIPCLRVHEERLANTAEEKAIAGELEEELVDRGRRGQDRFFSYFDFLSSVGALRCWQLEGGVFRGIVTELPRVVAEIWLEQVEFHNPTDPWTYNARFQPGSTEARDIFRERLETSLPGPDWMEFAVVDDLQDVTVTNRGLLLPAVPKPPLHDEILLSITTGKSGNPVFTDSKRPDRGN